jgi:hypothetical protein
MVHEGGIKNPRQSWPSRISMLALLLLQLTALQEKRSAKVAN